MGATASLRWMQYELSGEVKIGPLEGFGVQFVARPIMLRGRRLVMCLRTGSLVGRFGIMAELLTAARSSLYGDMLVKESLVVIGTVGMVFVDIV